MVLSGQYLERPALIPCGELTLEGLWHRGAKPPALLCCPPLEAAGMDAPAVAELAWASARAGHASLRFQHRGVGASTGERDPARALEDAEAALDHLAASAPFPTCVAGYGSGCETALALLARRAELRGGVLLAPPRLEGSAGRGQRLLFLVPEHGPRWLPEEAGAARVEVIEGADARFLTGLPRAAHLAMRFLGEA